jgi:hypothetical protein
VDIKPTFHNAVMIVGFAVLGLLAFVLAANNKYIAKIPIVGDAARLGASVAGGNR